MASALDPLDRLLSLPARANLLDRWASREKRHKATTKAGSLVAGGPKPPFEMAYGVLLAAHALDPRRMLDAVRHVRRAVWKQLPLRERALLLRLEGNALGGVGRANDAVRKFEKAWDIFRRAKDELECARTTIGWVYALGLAGNARQARAVAIRGRRLLPKDRAADRARLEANLGSAWLQVGRFDLASNRYRVAYDSFRRAEMGGEAGVCLLNLGMNAWMRAEIPKAKRYFESAQDELRRAGNTMMALYAQTGIAAAMLAEGDWNEAWGRVAELKERFGELGDARAKAWLHRELASVLVSLGADEVAAPEAESAWRELRRLGLEGEAARASFVRGRVADALGRRQLALSLFDEARRHWESVKNPWARDRVRMEQARVLLREGHAVRAAQLLREVLPVLDRRSPTGDAALARALLAEALLGMGRPRGALHLARRAWRDARRYPARLERPGIALVLARAFARLVEPARALQWSHRAVATLEEMLLRFGNRRLRLRVGGSRERIYGGAVDIALAHGGARALELAVDLVSKARTPVLIEDHGRRVLPGERAAVRSALARLREEILSAGDETKAGDERSSSLRRELERLDARLETEPSQLPRFLRRAWRERSFERWRARLGGRTLVIYDAPPSADIVPTGNGDDRAWRAFVVQGRNEVRCTSLPGASQAIQETWLSLRLALDTAAHAPKSERPEFLKRTREECDDALCTIRRVLWDPLEIRGSKSPSDSPRDREVVLVPAGPLHSIPLEAAIESGDGAPWVSRIPHPALLSTRGRRRSSQGLVLHGPSAGPAREARLVAAILSRTQRRVLVDRSRRSFDEAGRLGVLHVAAHGAFPPRAPFLSGLRLADGWLGLEELDRRRLEGALCVFTSCESGLAGVLPGSDLEGWIASGLAAGASELVLTLWKVDDESAHLFARSFYESWTRSERASRACRDARRRLREQEPHPYRWAPFFSVG